ncbi:hypothetical protein [Parabacteroides sp.]
MKKLLLSLILICGALNSNAQSSSTKEIAYVKNITPSGNLAQKYTDAIRNNVIQGLIESKRLMVKDIKSDQQFQAEWAKRGEDSSISEEEYGFQILRNLNARWVIGGNITRVEAVKKDTYYSATILISLDIIDVATGTIKTQESLSSELSIIEIGGNSTTGSTEDEALSNAAKVFTNRAKTFAENNFELLGAILEVSSEKKGKAEEVYIDLGESSGVKEGDAFEVFESRIIAGRQSKKKIGELKVKAVEGDDLALCKVTKSGDVILQKIQALGEGEQLQIESKRKKKPII